jgi:hypothetical protein
MKSILLLISICSVHTVLAQSWSTKDFKALQGLTGLWKMETSRGSIYEEWHVKNDHTLSGRSFKINNGDTLMLERVSLYMDGNKIIYSPTVTNQNNGQPVQFTLISTKDQRYIFENKEHDFPQRVIYHLVSNNAVHARIEGTKNGKQMGSDFNYSRLQ